MSSFRQTMPVLFGLTLVMSLFMTNGIIVASAQPSAADNTLVGVAMKGAYVDQKQNRPDTALPPATYFDDSFKLLKAAGLNHVRFLFYWEAYEKNPQAFMNEVEQVANIQINTELR